MSSGVKVDQECIEAFNQFKLGKKESGKAFILFGFNNEATKIIVLHREPIDYNESNKNKPWENLINLLPNDDVRYAVADVHYNGVDGPKTDMVFITWAPENSPVKRKMLMASSKDALKNALVGCRTTVQACCYPDLDLRSVVEKFKGTLD